MREHLLSDVPLGVWLSGGIDSSTILHYAAQASSSRLKTFSISFRGRSFDESCYIRQVVDHYGTEHEELDLNPDADLAGAIDEFAYYSDEPTADAGALPVWFLSKMCKTQHHRRAERRRRRRIVRRLPHLPRQRARAPHRAHLPASAVRLALQAISHWPVSDDKISFEYKLKRFLEGCPMPPERGARFLEWHVLRCGEAILLQSPAAPRARRNPGRAARKIHRQRDPYAPFLWFDQKYFLPDDILTKVDRMSMAHSVEVRPPFLDHRIVEFAATLAVVPENSGLAPEVHSERIDEKQTAASSSHAQESRFRYSRA